MKYCPNCGTKVSEGTRFCSECGRRLPADQDAVENISYSKALRWISGVFGVLSIFSAITGLEYFAVSGLASELIVDIVSIAIGLALLLMALVPYWVRSSFGIRLEKGSVFGLAVVLLVIVQFIVGALGPVPPGGWWSWSLG